MNRRLNLEETKNCLKLWREYKDRDALTTLVICNQGLVNLLANKYKNYNISFEDLQSAGNEGLLNAINKYNYKEKSIEAFSTYISTAIENEMLMELRKNKKHKNIISINQYFYKDDNKEIKVEDIIGTDADELDEYVIANVRKKEIYEVLERLTPRERKVLVLRYGLNDGVYRTLEEVGKIFGLTRERVRQIEYNSFCKIKESNHSKKLINYID